MTLYGRCQGYADSTSFRPSAIPSTAHVEGYEHGSIKANGILIDLSVSELSASADRDEIAGSTVQARVDGRKPAQIFHFYIQYNNLNVVFGYDLLAEPVEGSDQIRCTFSTLTDSEVAWRHDENIVPVVLPAGLVPFVIESGDAISITTLPLGEGRIAVTHFLRLTRTGSAPSATQ